jgi:diguanylate cyclase (GGDEF)-like protein/PAS domain S-box-containing protein
VVSVARHPVLPPGAVIRAREVEVHPSDLGEERFLSLARVIELGVVSADARGWVVYANEPAQHLLGLSETDVLGEAWRRVIHPDDQADVIDAAGRVVRLGTKETAVFRVAERWIAATAVPLGGAEHRTGWVATLEDITERHRVHARLAHQATHDDLTGLPNRSLVVDRLRQASARRHARGSVEDLAVLFIDLDGFKEINDTLGHAAGDAVLRVLAHRIAAVLRPGDTVGRVGGDEFVVVLEGVSDDEASILAAHLGEVVAAPIDHDGRPLSVRASVGLALAHPDDTPEQVLRRADEAMYRQKRTR